MSLNDDSLVSVLTVLDNDCEIIEDYVLETSEVLASNYKYYELLLVDNGSSDFTDRRVQSLQQNTPNLRLIRLSRRHDIETALAAALENCLGDYVIVMDVSSDPPALIPTLIENSLLGNDVVIAVRENREDQSWLRRWSAIIFYKVASQLLGYSLQPNATHFRAFSRQVVNSLSRIGNKSRYLKYLNALVGYKQMYLPYQRIHRTQNQKKEAGIFRLAMSGINIIISNSPAPLRLATLLGVIASTLCLLYFGYILIVTLVKRQITEGWITTNLMISTMFFLLFLILSILSEYIARILDESKDRPLYFIEYESQSSVTSFKAEIINETVNVV